MISLRRSPIRRNSNRKKRHYANKHEPANGLKQVLDHRRKIHLPHHKLYNHYQVVLDPAKGSTRTGRTLLHPVSTPAVHF